VLRRDRTENVTVIEGGDHSTNLPGACCDAIYMRDVYRHFTHPEDMNRSLRAALKPEDASPSSTSKRVHVRHYQTA